MNRPEENQDRKQERRKKFSKPKDKNSVQGNYVDDDKDIKHTQKKEIKKIKESFEDEEWEDWDRYYNH
jgi:hypothetical protein